MPPRLQGLEVVQLRTNLTVEKLDIDAFIGRALSRKPTELSLKMLQLLDSFCNCGCRVILDLVVVLMEANGCGGRRIPFEIGIKVIIDELGHCTTLWFFGFPASAAGHQQEQHADPEKWSHNVIVIEGNLEFRETHPALSLWERAG